MKYYIAVPLLLVAGLYMGIPLSCNAPEQASAPPAARSPQPAKTSLAQRLDSADPETRNEAILEIADMGYRGAPHVARLVELLQDQKRFIRKNAAIALGNIGPGAAAAVPALQKLLEEQPPTVAPVKPVVTGDDATAQPAPDKTPDTPAPGNRLRIESTLALGKIGPASAPAIPYLVNMMGDEDETLADAAAEALGNIGEAAVPPLSASLKHKKARMRRNAATALGYLAPISKTEAANLIAVLRDADDGVRAAAVVALAKIGPLDDRVIPAVLSMLRDDTPAVQGATLEALRIMGEPATTALLERIATETGDRKQQALEELKQVGPGRYKQNQQQQETPAETETKTGAPKDAPAGK